MKQTEHSRHAGGWKALTASTSKLIEARDYKKSILALLDVNQQKGFDCPGCAWPDPKNPATTEFCENGVKAVVAETTGKRVDPDFFAKHSVSSLVDQTDYWLESQGRLTDPMVYDSESDHYKPISWESAFALLAQELNSLDTPDEAIFYTSGRTSNEAAFLYQLFVRMFGTNNLPDCSNMCHESSGVAMSEAIGVGKGTVSLEDFDKADMILILGQNPGTNHPRMLTELQKANKRGAKIVTMNPLVEKGLKSFLHPQHPGAMLSGKSTAISTSYLQPLIGGDLAALKGIMKWVLEFEDKQPGTILDQSFIKEHTTDFESFREDLKQTDWSVVESQSGLTKEQLKEVAEIYINAKAVIACWAMGLTQQVHAVATIQQVLNLLFLKGNIGREGAGACPVRGHSNVQGDRTMGIYEKPKESFLQNLENVFSFEAPRKHGYDAVEAIEAMAEGKGKVFFAMGGNFVRATPDSAFTEAALRKCNITVHVTTKLNKSHLVHGEKALILPCLGRTELDVQKAGVQSVTVEDSMSMVHASTGRRKPASGNLLSEPAIVAGLAKATLQNSGVDWEALASNYDLIRDKIEAAIPGFENFNQRIKEPGGFYLGNKAREKSWETQSGKAQFTVSSIPDLSTAKNVFRLMTIRSHDQYNTTIYGLDDRYRNVKGERRILFINEADKNELGLAEDQLVDLKSEYGDNIERVAPKFKIRSYDIPRGCLAAYFPETNVLVSVSSVAEKSNTPVSKFVPVSIHPTS